MNANTEKHVQFLPILNPVIKCNYDELDDVLWTEFDSV
jgi:hypothetical protein